MSKRRSTLSLEEGDNEADNSGYMKGIIVCICMVILTTKVEPRRVKKTRPIVTSMKMSDYQGSYSLKSGLYISSIVPLIKIIMTICNL